MPSSQRALAGSHSSLHQSACAIVDVLDVSARRLELGEQPEEQERPANIEREFPPSAHRDSPLFPHTLSLRSRVYREGA